MSEWGDNTPKVSIVIPFFNCPYIGQAIECALNQSYPNVEVIVVNDGSTQHVDKIAPYLDRIRYVVKENGGTASALNVGIQHATGKYFSWLSSDDLYHVDKIEKQIFYMEKLNLYVCYSSFVYMNEESQVVSGPIGTKYANNLQFFQTLRNWCPINGCTVMLRMEVFAELGLFNEYLPFANDYDFWLRVCPKYEFHYFDEPLVKYRVHENMGTKKYDRVIVKEIFLIQQKHRASLDALIQKEMGR
jgi:glycosyltransferase involved in cell wall biosynthesis